MIAALLTAAVCAGPIIPSKNFGPDVQRKCLESTVRLREKKGAVQGTGVVIGSGVFDTGSRKQDVKFVLTASHVVPGIDKDYIVEAYSLSGAKPSTQPLLAKKVFSDDTADLALMMFTDIDYSYLLTLGNWGRENDAARKRFPAVEFVTTHELDRSGWGFNDREFPALSVGCSEGNRPTCREDLVFGKRLVYSNNRPRAFFWETVGENAAGRSGGPLFDKSGKIIGICSAKQEGKSYYVHTDEICNFLKKADKAGFRLATAPKLLYN